MKYYSDFITLFDSLFYKPTQLLRTPQYSFKAGKEKYKLEIELPGLRKDQVEVSLEKTLLVKTPKTELQFRLYEDAQLENITAKMEDGLLTIEVPREVKKESSRKIVIQ